MSFNFGSTVTNDFSTFSDDEKLNYALKLALNRVQTWGKTPWYEEPSVLTSTLPNLTLKNKIPPGSEIETYYLVDPDLGKATDRNVLKAIGSNDYNTLTINTIDGSTYASNPPIRSKNGTETISVTNNGETKTLLKGISKTMIAKYVYWQNKLTGKVTKSDGTGTTTITTTGTGTYPDKTAPFASFMTLSNVQNDYYVNDRRVSTMKEGGSYSTLYDTLESYYSGLEIIHWSSIDADGTAPPSKRHPFFKVFIGLPTYSTYSDALKTNFNNIGVSSSQSGDNIGFTNKLLEGAMGSINGYKFYLSTWNKKTQQFKQKKEDTYGDANNLNILYFLSYSGFILNYGEKNILDGKGTSIDDTSISIKYPPTISFVKYTGETFSDGIISQGDTLPAVEVSNDKDLFINTTDNTIHRLEDNNGTKTWVGIGGGDGTSGDLVIDGVLQIKSPETSGSQYTMFRLDNRYNFTKFSITIKDYSSHLVMLDEDNYPFFTANNGKVGIGTNDYNNAILTIGDYNKENEKVGGSNYDTLRFCVMTNSSSSRHGLHWYNSTHDFVMSAIRTSVGSNSDNCSLYFYTSKDRANPTEKMSIDGNGNVIIRGNLAVTGSLTSGGGGQVSPWDTNSPGMIHYRTGNVGIGTDYPFAKLHVSDSILIDAYAGDKGIFFKPGFTTNALYNISILAYKDGGSSGDTLSINAYSGITFCTGSNSRNERMRVTTNGNVGIGTNSPSTLLVVGEDGGGHPTNTPGIHMKSIVGNTPKHYVVGQDTTHNLHLSYHPNTTVSNGYGILSCYGGNNNLVFQHSGGSVGIGTTSPQAKLHVSDSILIDAFAGDKGIFFRPGFTTDALYNISILAYKDDDISGDTLSINAWDGITFCTGSNSRNERMRVAYNGRVGIGTTSPAAKLHVYNGGIWVTGAYGSDDVEGVYINSDYSNGDTGGWVEIRETGDSKHGARSGYSGSTNYWCVQTRNNSTSWVNRFRIGRTGNIYLDTNIHVTGTINSTGYIGIGVTDPTVPLHCTISRSATYTMDYYDYGIERDKFWDYDDSNYVWRGGWVYSASKSVSLGGYFNESVRAHRFFVTSDRRIKDNIIDIPDDKALEILRKIPCRYYGYKDKLAEGPGLTPGFIAQEVMEVFPMAVSNDTSAIIPNEYRSIENPIWNEIIDNSGNKKYKLTIPDLKEPRPNNDYKFYFNDISKCSMGNCEHVIKSIEDDPYSFILDEKYEKIFLYGNNVDDFHLLDKSKLFTINFSATQEIDRIQQQQLLDISGNKVDIELLKLENETLKTENNELANKINNLENQNANLLSRLEAIEKRVEDANI